MRPCKPFIQLIKISLVLNRKLILWLLLGFGLLFILTANMGPAESPLYWIALFGGGFWISTHSYRDLRETGAGIHYLTLPCSALMRHLSIWLLTGPIYYIFITSVYGIAVLAHVISKNFWGFGDPRDIFILGGEYLTLNAFCLLGAIVFKKLPALKTFFCLLFGGMLIMGSIGLIGHEWGIAIMDTEGRSLYGLLSLLAWLLAYWRLKKVELK